LSESSTLVRVTVSRTPYPQPDSVNFVNFGEDFTKNFTKPKPVSGKRIGYILLVL